MQYILTKEWQVDLQCPVYIYIHIYLFVIKYIIQSWCIMSLDYKSNLETDKENGEVILIQRKQSHLQIKPLSLGWVTCTNLLPHFFVFQARLHHYLYHFRVAALWCTSTLSKTYKRRKKSLKGSFFSFIYLPLVPAFCSPFFNPCHCRHHLHKSQTTGEKKPLLSVAK